MKTYIVPFKPFHSKPGTNKEQCLDYLLNGRHGKHDNLRWNEGSDLPEQRMSVKSARFSLTAGGQLSGTTLAEMLDDYFSRVHSTSFTYITNDYVAYQMNATEFREFLNRFAKMERDSKKNGGKVKVRVPHETADLVAWLAERV